MLDLPGSRVLPTGPPRASNWLMHSMRRMDSSNTVAKKLLEPDAAILLASSVLSHNSLFSVAPGKIRPREVCCTSPRWQSVLTLLPHLARSLATSGSGRGLIGLLACW